MRLPPAKTQGGFSMVELMVALLLGVILTSGVISVFITSKNTYNLNSAVGQVQDEGRFALTTLQPILAMAGFTGCSHIAGTSLNGFKNLLGTGDSDPVYMVQYGVYGFEYVGTTSANYTNTAVGGTYTDTTGQTPAVATAASEWSPALPAELFTKISNASYPVVKYSDILIVHEAQSNPAAIDTDPGVNTTLVYATTNAPAMAANGLALVSNCSNQVTAFQITAWSAGNIGHSTPNGGTPGNVTTNTNFNSSASAWPNTFSSGSVSPELTYVFYIGKSSVDQGTSLYEVTMPNNSGSLGTPVEIVPGAENMQLLYGADTDGDQIPNLYETADNITNSLPNPPAPTSGLATQGVPPDGNWNEVVSVRVALLVHSDNNSTDNNTSVTTSGGTTQTLTNVASQKFYMLGTSSTDSFTYTSFADRRLRRLFQETFSVRSQLP